MLLAAWGYCQWQSPCCTWTCPSVWLKSGALHQHLPSAEWQAQHVGTAVFCLLLSLFFTSHVWEAQRFHLFTHLILLSVPSRFTVLVQTREFPFFHWWAFAWVSILTIMHMATVSTGTQLLLTHREILFSLAMFPEVELVGHGNFPPDILGGLVLHLFSVTTVLPTVYRGPTHHFQHVTFIFFVIAILTDLNSVSLWVVFIFIGLLVSSGQQTVRIPLPRPLV